MQKQLKDGLVLRSLSEGFATDKANLGKFYDETFTEAGDEDGPALRDWAEDLISDKHPTTTLDDIWVVVDPSEVDKIVSALLLIPQTWAYDGVEMGVGRVELVATDADYRRRGLIRALMDAAHERSAELGHLVQSITGIPHYYRRFGYAMAVDLGGHSMFPMSAIRKLKDDETPEYMLRPAISDDIPNLLNWQSLAAAQYALRSVDTEAIWRYEINERSSNSPHYHDAQIIVNAEGTAVGYVLLQRSAYFSSVSCISYVIGEKASYLATFDDVAREIQRLIQDYYAPDDRPDMPAHIYFDSSVPEFVHTLVRKTRGGVVYDTQYAWYLRVPNMPQFIRAISPVLERRLIGSGAHGYTGDLKIHFFDTTALIITWEKGCIKEVKQETMMPEFGADAAFPYHYFLNVLFGHRSAAELQRVMPEVWFNRKAALMFDALFPVKPSGIVPLS